MDRWRRALPLVAWLGALAGGLVLFHTLGQGAMAPPPLTDPGAWGPWLSAREPAVAVVALLRLVVLALAWYLVGATTVGIVARLVRAAGLIRVADALTLPMVRRLLQGALGISLATAMVGASTAPVVGELDAPRLSVAAPATTGTEATAPRLVLATEPQVAEPPAVTSPDAQTSSPVAMRLVEEDPAASGVPAPEVAPADAAVDDGEHTHAVVAGESLWSIAEAALTRHLEREPGEGEVLGYWHEVIERNRSALADPDNPDLIFPGDEIALPTFPDPA